MDFIIGNQYKFTESPFIYDLPVKLLDIIKEQITQEDIESWINVVFKLQSLIKSNGFELNQIFSVSYNEEFKDSPYRGWRLE